MDNSDSEKDILEEVEEISQKLEEVVKAKGETAFQKYPLTFALLGTFGIAGVIYGFERVLDGVPIFRENPWAILVLGIILLVVSGTLYKRLRGFD